MILTDAVRLGRDHITSDSAALDVQLLLCHVIDQNRAYLISHGDESLTPQQKTHFLALLERRVAGEPIAYLLGQQEFWSLPFQVNQHTLIPRADTESLIEHALTLYSKDQDLDIADLGSGSGCIGLTLAHCLPKATVLCVEQSRDALSMIEKNRQQLNLNNAKAVEGNWCRGLDEQCFDLIISNPPYVRESDEHLAQGDVRFEPTTALTAGADGLDDIRQLASQVPHHIKPNGHFIVEFGYDQSAAVKRILSAAGFQILTDITDLGGHIRGVDAQRQGRRPQ